MGKGKTKKNKKQKKQASAVATKNVAADVRSERDGLYVDPSRVRFQHSRIRPVFSGCGRSVEGTLESIRRGELSPTDLPPIQVIVGPETDEGPWYFSLNNRRLWVLKRCREEGLLENNVIWVRVRQPKSRAERERYSIGNCAIEAKIVPEKKRLDTGATATKGSPISACSRSVDIEAKDTVDTMNEEKHTATQQSATVADSNTSTYGSDIGSAGDSDDDDSDAPEASFNPFSILM